MNRHVAVVAYGFKWIGGLFAIPSLPALAWLLWIELKLYFAAPEVDGSTAPASSSKLVSALVAGDRSNSQDAQFYASVGEWILSKMAVLAAIVCVIALILYFTGRGLDAHRAWARAVAILFTLGLLFLSAAGLHAYHRGLAALTGWTFVLASLYCLWALLWEFQ